jgi:hypothetical protein
VRIDVEPAFAEAQIEAASRGDLLEQGRIKSALLARHGVDRAFEQFKSLLSLPQSFAIETKAILSLSDVASRQAEGYFEIDAGGIDFEIAPPKVEGNGNHSAIKASSRAEYVASLAEARVRGGSAAIEIGDAVLIEDGMSPDQDPAIFVRRAGEAWTIVPRQDEPALELDEAIMLLGPRASGFGTWLWEHLAKIVAAASTGKLPKAPLLIDSGLGRNHADALKALLPDWDLRELSPGAFARVRRLWIASSPTYLSAISEAKGPHRWDRLATPPARFVPVVTEVNRRLDALVGAEENHERIFLRGSSHHPKLEDPGVVGAIAEARAFRVVDPDGLDFARQVSLLRGARYLVAPLGPQLFLTPFAREGTKLCILHHPHTAGISLLTGILDKAGIDCTVLTGDFLRYDANEPQLSDYRIGEQQFARFLHQWLEAS